MGERARSGAVSTGRSIGFSALGLAVASALAAPAGATPGGPGPGGASAHLRGLVFRVDTTVDAHDARPGDGRCADAAGRCTLRAALEEGAATPADVAVTIVVPAGYYRLRLGALVVGGASVVSAAITLRGAGSSDTVVDGADRSRVLAVAPGGVATIEQMEITRGNAGNAGYGGGILSAGALVVADCVVTRNRAAAGGGLANAGGTLVVTGSTIDANDGGPFGGGGIQNGGSDNLSGSVRVVSSVVTGNVTTDQGGGIFQGQDGHPANRGRTALAPVSLVGWAPPHPASGSRSLRSQTAVSSGQDLEVIDSDVSDNVGTNGGGGIAADGASEVVGSVIDGNSSGHAPGGGTFDVEVIRDSRLSGNRAESGGAIEIYPGVSATIATSTLSDNRAVGYGGAVDESGAVSITRSTIAGNVAGGPFVGEGAAFEIEGGAQLSLVNDTVTGNVTRPGVGYALDNYGGAVTISYSTFSRNDGDFTGGGYTVVTATIAASSQTVPSCAVHLRETVGYNLDSDDSCGFHLATDQRGVDPRIGPLADNGGPTETEALLPGSPAIDHGGTPASAGCPLTDQRGDPRPWGPACDAGSFELQYRLRGGVRARLAVLPPAAR